MANTLKDLTASAKLVSEVGLERALTELKNYIDTQDAAKGTVATETINAVSQRLDALIGAAEGDTDKLLNTFNEIKAFLADYSEDDTLKSLIDAVKTAVGAETTRATQAEGALGDRIDKLESLNVMTTEQAGALFNSIFASKADN